MLWGLCENWRYDGRAGAVCLTTCLSEQCARRQSVVGGGLEVFSFLWICLVLFTVLGDLRVLSDVLSSEVYEYI